MANSKRRCTQCKTYKPVTSMQIKPAGAFCNMKCLMAYANDKKNTDRLVKIGRKEVNRQLKQRKEKIKTLGEHKKELQTIFNKWVRLMDEGQPCISCQRHHTGQYHAGHYRSVGSAPELRYEPLNVHRQCSACNNHLSGNLIQYRVNLIKKIGLEKVEWLEGKHEPKHYKISDIVEMKATYRSFIRKLEQDKAA